AAPRSLFVPRQSGLECRVARSRRLWRRRLLQPLHHRQRHHDQIRRRQPRHHPHRPHRVEHALHRRAHAEARQDCYRRPGRQARQPSQPHGCRAHRAAPPPRDLHRNPVVHGHRGHLVHGRSAHVAADGKPAQSVQHSDGAAGQLPHAVRPADHRPAQPALLGPGVRPAGLEGGPGRQRAPHAEHGPEDAWQHGAASAQGLPPEALLPVPGQVPDPRLGLRQHHRARARRGRDELPPARGRRLRAAHRRRRRRPLRRRPRRHPQHRQVAQHHPVAQGPADRRAAQELALSDGEVDAESRGRRRSGQGHEGEEGL
ncbi:hypothetical protein LTR60_005549, partial [Cryomyces antarcticus]